MGNLFESEVLTGHQQDVKCSHAIFQSTDSVSCNILREFRRCGEQRYLDWRWGRSKHDGADRSRHDSRGCSRAVGCGLQNG